MAHDTADAPVTVVVMPRDHFSTTERCLDHVLAHTELPYELRVLSGGAPAPLERRWQQRYGDRVAFELFPEYRNGAELRNYAFDTVATRLVAFVDSDTYVRPGWLRAMVRCQRDTGAAMVTPLILDRDERVHCAGNDLFVVDGPDGPSAVMELRYQHHRIDGAARLERRRTDFCEMHCQLAVTAVGRELRLFDPELREFQEMDAGLTLAQHGHEMWFEPEAVVYLFYEQRLTDPVDVALHRWKWDMDAMHAGFAYFREKWGLDIDPGGHFDRYLRSVNARVGFFSRRRPSRVAALADRALGRARRGMRWAGP